MVLKSSWGKQNMGTPTFARHVLGPLGVNTVPSNRREGEAKCGGAEFC